jgi:hypothetical protein
MRTLLYGITAIALLASSAGAQNLLTNPSFEAPDVAPGTAEIFGTSIPGWSDESFCGIEVQDHCCGDPSDGAQLVELNSNCPGAISQTVATQPGAKYVLTFDYSVRPGIDSNWLFVKWNDTEVFEELRNGSLTQQTEWTHHAVSVTAAGTSSTVELSSMGFSDPDAGTLVDNLPEPTRRSRR